ncbi:fiber [Thalictrum thalictroides]|uniref:Fiber n=1 Tax=Thalictrum thalictroides TaxID=46969 RepID=A0A7J6WPK9_THATH|nr:fiber [Thalictrum thalictroides]
MASSSSTVLLVLVFIIDVIAFALAVAAEQRRSSAHIAADVQQNKYCVYDSDIATGLGIGALVSLMVSQVIVMVASRCFCCGKALGPGRSRAWAIVLFITCWVTFIIAEVCLLAGSVRNAYQTKYINLSEQSPSCQTLRKGVFGAGAAFIVFTGICSEMYYFCYSKAKGNPPLEYERDTGVRMGNYN